MCSTPVHLIMTTSQKMIALVLAGAALTGFTAFGAAAAANWTEHCAKCHGEDGKGDTKMGRKLSIASLADPAVQARFTDEAALKAMKEGVKDKSDKQVMKPAENLSEEDMKALVTFVRGLKK
jgi:cytochrome c553